MPGAARAFLTDELGAYGVKLDTKERGSALAIFLQPRIRMELGDQRHTEYVRALPEFEAPLLRQAPVLAGIDFTLGKNPAEPGNDSRIHLQARGFAETPKRWAAYRLAIQAVDERAKTAKKKLRDAFRGWLDRNRTEIAKSLPFDSLNPTPDDMRSTLTEVIVQRMKPTLGSSPFRDEATFTQFLAKATWSKPQWVMHIAWAEPKKADGIGLSEFSAVNINVDLSD
ncbi:MAG: hypothetical protein ACOYON_11860 [Fimbriimonas sp.]